MMLTLFVVEVQETGTSNAAEYLLFAVIMSLKKIIYQMYPIYFRALVFLGSRSSANP